MQNKTKKIFNNLLTIFLVLGTLGGVYLFSVFAMIGVMSTIVPESFGRQIFPATSSVSMVILISVATIVLLPLFRIIWQSAGRRWETTHSAALLLWPYLIFSFITIYISLFLVTQLNWFAVVGPSKQPHMLISGIFISLLLLSIYIWYSKKIKTLLLKK